MNTTMQLLGAREYHQEIDMWYSDAISEEKTMTAPSLTSVTPSSSTVDASQAGKVTVDYGGKSSVKTLLIIGGVVLIGIWLFKR